MNRRYKTFSGPTNRPEIADIVEDLVRRVKALEIPRAAAVVSGPKIPLPIMSAVDYSGPSISVTSASFVPIAYPHCEQQHFNVDVRVKFNVAASTTAEVRLVNNDNDMQIGGTLTVAGPTFNYYDLSGSLGSFEQYSAKIVRIEARRSVGAGAVGVAVAWAYGA